MPKLGRYFWIRLGLMAAVLVAVVFLIAKLNRFPTDQSTADLCPTRIKSLALPDGSGIVQEGLAWYRRRQGQLEELDPIAVEKWFARHCRVTIETIAEAPPGGGPKTVAWVAEYVSGPPQILYHAGLGQFNWQSLNFRSSELDAALKDLAELPLRLRPASR